MHIVLVAALLLGVSFIRTLQYRNTRKIETIYSGVIIFLFAALRGQNVGIDLATYSENYVEIASFSFAEILNSSSLFNWSRDPIFWIFMKVLTYISIDPQIMIISVSAIVSVSVSLLIFRFRTDVLLCFLIFICLRYYSFTLTGLRQAVAMSVLYFTFDYLLSKKLLPFVFITSLAAAFHISAITFLMAYPVTLIKKKRYILIASSIFVIVTFTFKGFFSIFLPLFTDRFTNYLEMTETAASGNVILGIYLLVLIFSLIQHKRIRIYILEKTTSFKALFRFSTNISMSFNFLIIGTAVSVVGMFFPNFFRIAYFFIIPSLFFLFPITINYYQKFFKGFSLKLIVVILLVSQYIILGPGSGIEDYVFFWE